MVLTELNCRLFMTPTTPVQHLALYQSFQNVSTPELMHFFSTMLLTWKMGVQHVTIPYVQQVPHPSRRNYDTVATHLTDP